MTLTDTLPEVYGVESLVRHADDVIRPERDDWDDAGDAPMGTTCRRHRTLFTVDGQRFEADVTEWMQDPDDCFHSIPARVPMYFHHGEGMHYAYLHLREYRWVDGRAVATWEAGDDA